jgi:hypothetical protein
MTKPPEIGKVYSIPCVFGTPNFFNRYLESKKECQWIPVFLPSHEDSEYRIRERIVNDKNEYYYEKDPSEKHHFHLDPRFIPVEWTIIQTFGRTSSPKITYEGIIFPVKYEIEYKNMPCLRLECGDTNPHYILGHRFVQDYREQSLNCMRCPHKGIDLRSIQAINDIISCPGHGLKFNAKTLQCISYECD